MSKVRTSLFWKIPRETIEEITKDIDQAYTITQKIIEKRQITERISLKRQNLKSNTPAPRHNRQTSR